MIVIEILQNSQDALRLFVVSRFYVTSSLADAGQNIRCGNIRNTHMKKKIIEKKQGTDIIGASAAREFCKGWLQ